LLLYLASTVSVFSFLICVPLILSLTFPQNAFGSILCLNKDNPKTIPYYRVYMNIWYWYQRTLLSINSNRDIAELKKRSGVGTSN